MEKLEEQNKLIVRKYWDGKWNERRPEILDELLSTDIRYHGEDEMTGIEEYKTSYSTYLSAMINTKHLLFTEIAMLSSQSIYQSVLLRQFQIHFYG